MPRVIRAKYINGALRPLDEIDLKEGDEVSVIIDESKPSSGIVDLVVKLRERAPKISDPEKILEELRR